MGGDVIDDLPAALWLKAGPAVLPSGHRLEDGSLQAGASIDKARLRPLEYAALYHISGIITEDSNPIVQEARIPFLGRSGSFFHGRIRRAPGLPIHHFLPGAKFRVQLPPDPVHQLHREKPHQVEPESVYMILLRPVHHGIRDIIVHHGTPCGNVIPTGGAVGETAVLLVAVIIPRHHPLQPGILLVGMVIHYIHNNPNPVFMQGLNHFLALPDPDDAIVGIRGIGALRHIVVHRVISPVELPFIPGLVYRSIVKERQKLHMGDAQPLQIFHAGGIVPSCPVHGKRLVLPPVFPGDAALDIIGKILDMQLIDNPFSAVPGRPVRLKSRRIRPGEIHHHASAAVTVTAHRVRIRSARVLPVYPHQIIIVHAVQALRKFQLPYALFIRLHLSSETDIIRNSVFIET